MKSIGSDMALAEQAVENVTKYSFKAGGAKYATSNDQAFMYYDAYSGNIVVER